MRQQTWNTTEHAYLDKLASSKLVEEAQDDNPEGWAERLDAIDELRRRLNGWELDAIVDAREQAVQVTWQQIADRTGHSSRQAAHKHFTDLAASLD